MATQRRIDLVLDSVKRLVRLGATANLLNLLQKQHPADLAQIFGELQERAHRAGLDVLVLPRVSELMGGRVQSNHIRRIEISDVGIRRPTLDDVFLTLTGHGTDAGEPADDPAPSTRQEVPA